MKKNLLLLLCLFIIISGCGVTKKSDGSSSGGSSRPTVVIIDHTYVDKYDDIPQYWINEVKKMWVNVAGESHSSGYRIGLDLLEAQDSRFQVVNTEAGTPEMADVTINLRSSPATWGDVGQTAGWVHLYGEEDWYTSATAIANTKAHLQYCKDNNFGLSAFGFGWCWDMTWQNNPDGPVDPVYKCRWAGSSEGGPQGNLRWGLDAADNPSNSVCLDTYLQATQAYIDYCRANNIATKVFFTTGPVDDYSGESGYQRQLKQDRIRAYVRNNGGYLFDYADILAWDDAGTEHTEVWTDADGGTHRYQMIADDNMLDLVGPYDEDGDHIGERGALRLGKATWVMLALMAGWDGK